MVPPNLSTARLTLRPLDLSDEVALVAALQDPTVSRWLTLVPYPYGAQDFHAFLPLALPGKTWAILDDAGFAGVISLDGDFGYWLAKRAWGRGYMTEAATAVLDAHFSDPAAYDVASGYFVVNSASGRVLEKLGFRYVTTIDQQARSAGLTLPLNRVALNHVQWQARLPASHPTSGGA